MECAGGAREMVLQLPGHGDHHNAARSLVRTWPETLAGAPSEETAQAAPTRLDARGGLSASQVLSAGTKHIEVQGTSAAFSTATVTGSYAAIPN